jgi:hypothetical protein
MDNSLDHTGGHTGGESRRIMVGIDIVVIATIFTLIVLLTGGPGNRL